MRAELLKERGPLCEHCGVREWQDCHHVLVHDSKRLHKQVTVPENLMCVCRECHPYLNGHEVRRDFRDRQVNRGYDIRGWYNSLDMKIKEAWLQNGG